METPNDLAYLREVKAVFGRRGGISFRAIVERNEGPDRIWIGYCCIRSHTTESAARKCADRGSWVDSR